MLDDLLHVIETLQQRIRDHGSTLRENETRTRTALIDPMLRVLGWEVSDPSVVTAEYPVGRDRVDYALLNEVGSPIAFVEAKSLGTPLEQDRNIDQLVRYAFTDGIPYAVLTDGSDWHVYDLASPTMAFKDRRILDVSVARGAVHETALNLLLLWKANLSSGRPTEASSPLWAERAGANDSDKHQMSATSPATNAVSNDATLIPLSTFLGAMGDAMPISMRFPDGDELQVNSWNHLVRNSVTWLSLRKKLSHNDVPIESSSKRYIVNTQPVHPTGNPFAQQIWVREAQLVYEGNISRKAAVSNTKKLLERCGVNPADVLLRVG